MKLGIMQPYFLPYIGYFQLIAAVDVFIVYDNIKYTKRGWINRNRILVNGRDATFSLPLRGDSDSAHVMNRELAASFDRKKLLNQFRGAYNRAPHFEETFSLLEGIIGYQETNLFKYIYNSIIRICKHLEIATDIRVSSVVPIDHGLRNQDKVLALCKAMGADTYINAIGGTDLYSRQDFRARNIELKFIHPQPPEYMQYDPAKFIPNLSIVDVMMFNRRGVVASAILRGFELL